MSYGTLAAKPELRENWPWKYHFIGPPPATRPEEYHFVLDQSKDFKHRDSALDAACGYLPQWHIFGHNFAHHYQIPTIAFDANPESLWLMEEHHLIIRMMGDLCGMPFADRSFDIVFCLSVIEHLPYMYRSRALMELCRVSRKHLVITFDGLDVEQAVEAVSHYGFTCGERKDQAGEVLTNEKGEPIHYLIAERADG